MSYILKYFIKMGFRKAKGIWDNLAYLTAYVHICLSKGEKVIGILLDIQQAYDNVNPYLLYNILLQNKVESDLTNVILKIITDRKIYTKDNKGNLYGPISSNIGIPQGSPLSPILFNIYTCSLIKNISNHIRILSFADDLILIIKGKEWNIIKLVIEGLEKIQDRLISHNLKLSLSKCEIIDFSGNYIEGLNAPFIIGEFIIPVKRQVRYLGAMFQSKLKWDAQVQEMIKKAN